MKILGFGIIAIYFIFFGGFSTLMRVAITGDIREQCQVFYGDEWKDINPSWSIECSNGKEIKVLR